MARKIDDPAVADAYNLALDLEEQGDIDGAVEAFARYLALDPEDHGGAAIRLAAMGRAAPPQRAPEPYVEVLFDQHAEMFEDILVRQLGYRVPALMRERLDALALGPFERMLDLGCGTGLAAEAIGDRAAFITGVDLSSRMIDICEEKQIYDHLHVSGAETFLAAHTKEPFDLITACDVLPYLGALGPLFAGVAANLRAGGTFAFSSETLAGASSTDTFRVAPHKRFVHAETYISDQLKAADLEILEITAINVRNEDNAPTPGQLIVAQRSPASPAMVHAD